MADAGGRIQFDFDGSLELARQLWALASELATEDFGRDMEFHTAKDKWRGSKGDDFVNRRETERSSRSNVYNGLKEDAQGWAEAWAKAMHQQNTNNRAAAVNQASEDRGGWTKFVDATVGEDNSEDEVAAAETPPVPTPPQFMPTASEQVY